MSTSTRATVRTVRVAMRSMVLFTLSLGVLYTLVMTGVGQLLLPARADGSLLHDAAGVPVGSSLIGQSFTGADGTPLPEYFQPRPSAAGDGYDARASAGSNLGPENEDLVAAIDERRTQIAQFNGVDTAEVPADALTASASGLDPHISPEYAALQTARVAEQRDLPQDAVHDLVEQHTHHPSLGLLGEPRVNVLEVNLALDEQEDRG
jgi:K+-transporting ATPase ATPase C chain